MKYITNLLCCPDRSYPVITAHSGCEGTPDNSLEHVRTAIASGAECFEIDVHEHEGTLYLTHDAPSDYGTCPTLAQCYELVAADDRIMMQCDCKSFGLAEACIRLAAKYGIAHRVLVAGYVGFDEIPTVDQTESDWWLSMWPSDHEAEELAANFENLRAMEDRYRMINLHHRMVNDCMRAKIRDYGYHLSVWTVNTEEDLRRLMTLPEIRNITTRIPVLALKIRKELLGI